MDSLSALAPLALALEVIALVALGAILLGVALRSRPVLCASCLSRRAVTMIEDRPICATCSTRRVAAMLASRELEAREEPAFRRRALSRERPPYLEEPRPQHLEERLRTEATRPLPVRATR